ncbi:MAG: hypothetical protein KAT57_07735 [Candidatus Lokiarchaeota archaeon]|nr:hypothetical protein [Candidatus Lokiarchaeota archaeon]
MPQKIWKYPINTQDVNFVLEIPEGAKPLYFEVQRGIPTLWVLVSPEHKFEKRYFRIVGTGDTIEEENLSYIGTIQLADGDLIFHLFECLKN